MGSLDKKRSVKWFMELHYLMEDAQRALSNSVFNCDPDELEAKQQLLKENWPEVWVAQRESVFEALNNVQDYTDGGLRQLDIANDRSNEMGWYVVDMLENDKLGDSDKDKDKVQQAITRCRENFKREAKAKEERGKKQNPRFGQRNESRFYENYRDNGPRDKDGDGRNSGENRGRTDPNQAICYYCHESGHTKPNCPHLKKRNKEKMEQRKEESEKS